MDINVKLIQVFPVQTITSRDGSKSWQKQEFLTETIDNSQYPRKICFTLFGDNRVGIVDQYQPNTLINVSFDLQSRESNGRWFSSIDAWRVGPATTVEAPAAATVQPQAAVNPPQGAQPAAAASTEESADDLPF
ncbi:MAG: DUF3127 domain-containing protein [Paludibacteraceae bacterium]|nr:DUF3127 domain-containing protein [Paludibacteraceae bacterium]